MKIKKRHYEVDRETFDCTLYRLSMIWVFGELAKMAAPYDSYREEYYNKQANNCWDSLAASVVRERR